MGFAPPQQFSQHKKNRWKIPPLAHWSPSKTRPKQISQLLYWRFQPRWKICLSKLDYFHEKTIVGGFKPTPSEKLCSSKWVHLPQFWGEHHKNIWVATTQIIFHPRFPWNKDFSNFPKLDHSPNWVWLITYTPSSFPEKISITTSQRDEALKLALVVNMHQQPSKHPPGNEHRCKNEGWETAVEDFVESLGIYIYYIYICI